MSLIEEEAEAWQNAGFDLTEASQWGDALAIRVEERASDLAAHPERLEVQLVGDGRCVACPAKEALLWRELGFDPVAAREWDANISYVDGDISYAAERAAEVPLHAAAWRDAGIDPSIAARHYRRERDDDLRRRRSVSRLGEVVVPSVGHREVAERLEDYRSRWHRWWFGMLSHDDLITALVVDGFRQSESAARSSHPAGWELTELASEEGRKKLFRKWRTAGWIGWSLTGGYAVGRFALGTSDRTDDYPTRGASAKPLRFAARTMDRGALVMNLGPRAQHAIEVLVSPDTRSEESIPTAVRYTAWGTAVALG